MTKKAFTLIELIISIVILSIMMVFLFESYSQLNRSNEIFVDESENISRVELLKKTLYLDLTTALKKSVLIINQDKQTDILFLQTSNSIHKRINPYVAYIFKDKKLYRLESLKKMSEYPLVSDSEFVADELGNVKIFRIYKSNNSKQELYLLHIQFENEEEILLKVKVLNAS